MKVYLLQAHGRDHPGACNQDAPARVRTIAARKLLSWDEISSQNYFFAFCSPYNLSDWLLLLHTLLLHFTIVSLVDSFKSFCKNPNWVFPIVICCVTFFNSKGKSHSFTCSRVFYLINEYNILLINRFEINIIHFS